MMAKKLPIPVYAVRYRGSNRKEILDMEEFFAIKVQENDSEFWVRTPRGNLRLDSGAWLAYGLTDGEVRVIQDEIFKETYTQNQNQEPHLYIKNPVEVECIRIDNFNLVTVHRLLEFIHGGGSYLNHYDIFQIYRQAADWRSAGSMPISTLEGTMEAEVGDYLIRGPQGEVYPVAANVFDQIYSVED